MLDLFIWIIFGAIAGWIATLLAQDESRYGLFGDIVIGIVGAVVGGLIVRAIGGKDMADLNLSSLFVAVLGAVIVLLGFRSTQDR